MIEGIKIQDKVNNGNLSLGKDEMRVEFREPHRKAIFKKFANLSARVLKDSLGKGKTSDFSKPPYKYIIFKDIKSEVFIFPCRYSSGKTEIEFVISLKFKSSYRELCFKLEEIKEALKLLTRN